MAIRIVTSGTSINTAVQNANEGDLILVKNGEYNERVDVDKDFIRIVADGKNVVLNGKFNEDHGFFLNNTKGVEIKGFKIINFSIDGIHLDNSNYNRIVNNIIRYNKEDGIDIENNSDGNLVFGNCILDNGDDGIEISGDGNWIISNEIIRNREDGIDVDSSHSHNAIISNIICNNKGKADTDGIDVDAENTLILKNVIKNNGDDGIDNAAKHTVIIKNKIIRNDDDGIDLENTYNNAFVFKNLIVDNRDRGIIVDSDKNIIETNEIICNEDSGIVLSNSADKNTVIFNRLRNNVPFDIIDKNAPDSNNNIINNDCEESKPEGLCEKCSSRSKCKEYDDNHRKRKSKFDEWDF